MRLRDCSERTLHLFSLGDFGHFLIEAVLQAPQVLKKMQITTNPNDERKGSDGVHIRWTNNEEVLEVIFAEAKLYKDFATALTNAFISMTDFHNSATKH